jgi:hypothetical protein
VFSLNNDEKQKKRKLHAWYIENPYAQNKVDPSIFPTKSSWIMKGKTEKGYEMGWT